MTLPSAALKHAKRAAARPKVLCVWGTRPEAIKMAPVAAALKKAGLSTVCCVTGQHRELLHKAERVPAVFSIGQARTFGDEHPLLIEAHLLVEGIGEVNEEWMAMDFVQRLRSQHKFGTPEELAAQIARDCRQARDVLQRATKGD